MTSANLPHSWPIISKPSLVDQPGWQQLTPRERQVAALAGQRLTNQEIAEILTISPVTVKIHMRNLLAKLSLPHKTSLHQFFPIWPVEIQ